ncbi:hypothetical protein HMPREF0620_0861 [Parascardovia denticolens DSM 10105 = JCM 12538]|uniref:Uncharacterized protein n=1 Tax=Parascardovia denticolens DSM 10105 = JCM 12538 TaxID=864564 RepID=E6JYM9_PARDN|nr:hypothetical protein HMPREF0620_0861 [Parascardovia denticolens DSM 10105 = JCM 12538]
MQLLFIHYPLKFFLLSTYTKKVWITLQGIRTYPHFAAYNPQKS